MKQYLRVLFALFLLLLGIWGILALKKINNTLVPGIDEMPATELLRAIKGKLKHEQEINALIDCESGGDRMAINYNDGKLGSHSYSILQFKYETFKSYIRKYGWLSQAEDAELMNFIFDSDIQKALADKILDEPGGHKNWLNCWQKVS